MYQIREALVIRVLVFAAIITFQSIFPAKANIDKQEAVAAEIIDNDLAAADEIRSTANSHANDIETIEKLYKEAVSTLDTMKKSDQSGNPYYFARDADISKAKNIYDALVTDLTIKLSHVRNVHKQTGTLNAKKMKANDLVAKNLSEADFYKSQCLRTDLTDKELIELSSKVGNIYNSADTAGMLSSPYHDAESDGIVKLLNVYRPIWQSVNSRAAQASDRLSMLRADEERAKRGEPTTAASNALQQIIYYAMAEVCYDRGVAFSKDEVNSIKLNLSQALDAANVNRELRDKQWQNVQMAMNAKGFRNLNDDVLRNECNGIKQTIFYMYPQVFNKTDVIPKNPF